MANQQQTNQLVRIPFLEEANFRSTDATKDDRFINGFFEPINNPVNGHPDYFFLKRPGLSQNIRPSGGAATGRGVFVWNGNIYSVFGTQIYKNGVNLGVTLSTASGLCKFTTSRPGAATPYLCINDGQALYCVNGAGVTTQVVTNFPVNTRDVVFLDQYVLVLDTNARLWNSTADDPITWDGTSNIIAQMLPGKGVGLARQNAYVVLFTDQHLQMFYDNANASGSPLNNADSLIQQVGCASNDTIVSIEESVYWVGGNQNGGPSVWKISGTTDIKDIANPTIRRILGVEGTNLTSARAVGLRCAGHRFYVLTLIGANRTFVYDPDIELWYEWTDTTGSAAWPIVASSEINGQPIVQHSTNGWIYNLSPSVYQDDSVNFTVTARTPRMDFGAMSRKFVNRLDVICDIQSSAGTINVSYSDDDYATFSTARTFDVSKSRNFSRVWGNFRRRAWQVSFTANLPFRGLGIELDVTVEI